MDPAVLYEALMGPQFPRVKRYGTQGWKPLEPGVAVQPQDLVEAGPGGATVNVEGYPGPQELRPEALRTWLPHFAPPSPPRPRPPIVSGSVDAADWRR